MDFKYFDNAELFTKLHDIETKCHCCKKTKLCYDAEAFYGSSGFFGFNKMKSICPDCLASGQLNNYDITTCNGDSSELKRQLKDLNPQLSDSEIDNLVETKTNELEKTTPPLITWQEWPWPCLDGDYCKFIGYGSKPFYNKLAKNNNGKSLFTSSFYYKIKDASDETLWDNLLPDEEIKNYEDSNYDCLFYVFKSLNSDKIVTNWDCS